MPPFQGAGGVGARRGRSRRARAEMPYRCYGGTRHRGHHDLLPFYCRDTDVKHFLLSVASGVVLIGLAAADNRAAEADLVFVGGDEHNHLDPQKMSWLHDIRIANCLYEPLVKHNAVDLSIEPGVAESWTVSSDKLTYTFKLRQDARWSNGDPVVAGDFVFAWRRALLYEMAADYTKLFFCLRGAEDFFDWRKQQLARFAKGSNDTAGQLWQQAQAHFAATVGLAAPDERTLVVTLVRPTAYFLELCAFATFMPNHVRSVEAVTSIDPASGMLGEQAGYWSDPSQLVCNGPYVLKRRRFKRDLLMVANDHFWDRRAMANSSIMEKIISNPQTALLAYQRGEVNWLPDIPSASSVAADLAKLRRPDTHLVSMAGVYFYNFNCKARLNDGSANPLADKRLRQALSMGIDRKTLVSKVTRLNQPVARSFVPPDAIAGYDPPVEAGIGFDPAGGRKLLAQAGYRDGRDLAGLSILYNTGFGHETIAQAIKRMWQQHLGVVVKLEGVEVKAFSERLKKHDYTIARAAWFGDYRDPTTWLDKMMSDNGNNDCAYSSREYDDLMRSAADAVADPAQRLALLRQAEAVMLDDSPMAMIYQYISIFVYDPHKLRGMTRNPWNIWRLENVRVMR